jgi:hypothetical protein
MTRFSRGLLWMAVASIWLHGADTAHAKPVHSVKVEPVHLWQLVAQNPTTMMFIDTKSKVLVSPGLVRFWVLSVEKNSSGEADRQKYNMVDMTANCADRSVRFNGGYKYVDGDGTGFNGSNTFTVVAPESVGEFMVLFVCNDRLKYKSVSPSTSIAGAFDTADLNFGAVLTEPELREVAKTFHTTIVDVGMMGLADTIKECYSATTREQTLSNVKAVTRCLVLDIMAYKFDVAFRAEMKSETGNEPPASFYFDDASVLARARDYSTFLVGVSPSISSDRITEYSSQANGYLLELMDKEDKK